MSTHANAASGSAPDRVATRNFVTALILAGLLLPFASFFASLGGHAAAAAFHVFPAGPPLGFARPHDGQVIAHLDALGKWPADIARIRVGEAASGVTVWDVNTATARSECWNGCWNVTLRAGANPASFAAGPQQFNASVPQGPSFSLTRGTPYFFEVWDSKGRVKRRSFTL